MLNQEYPSTMLNQEYPSGAYRNAIFRFPMVCRIRRPVIDFQKLRRKARNFIIGHSGLEISYYRQFLTPIHFWPFRTVFILF